MFEIQITDEDFVIRRLKSGAVTRHPIFLGSDNVKYIREGNKFVCLVEPDQQHVKTKTEKVTHRGATHVYPHRELDIPEHLRSKS